VKPVNVLAAGSLRAVWQPLMAAFQHRDVVCRFGPAGLLRERLAAGEPGDLFASANMAHPQALLNDGRALFVAPFAANRLCLTVRADAVGEADDWLTLLTRPDLRVGISTPGCDPSGDYAWQLFSRMGAHGERLKRRAKSLVGGRTSLPLPAGSLAAEWLIANGHADLFIGYASYAPRLRQIDALRVVAIPEPYNPTVEYGLACLSEGGRPLAEFLLSSRAGAIIRQHGFTLPAGSPSDRTRSAPSSGTADDVS
jgi:molybdate transport system substrate-binding protein